MKMFQSSQSQAQPKPRRVNLEDALNMNVWDVDGSPHISVNSEKCSNCKSRPCIFLCPANAFTLLGERVLYGYEGCIECGTCRVLCPEKAITWNYPLSGRGVQYRF